MKETDWTPGQRNFIEELETRSMSTWTDEELANYKILTGQDEEDLSNDGSKEVW